MKNNKPFRTFLVKFIGTGMGVGYAPKMPGTVGSFLGLTLYWLFFPEQPSVLIHVVFFVIIALSFAAGVWAGTESEKFYGNDPSCVVIDEIAGMWIALFLLPKVWIWSVAAFFLFRLFDIFKWLGCNALQRLRGGWGIMMDDVLAGVWANVILQIMIFTINRI
jgi:phosphatidylglycerophosphatase A